MEPESNPKKKEDKPHPDLGRELSGEARFQLGQLVATPGALNVLSSQDILRALRQHLRGDWGEVDPHDQAENELSLREGFRLLSAYTSGTGKKFWIITEADRSLTTVLLPEEY